MKVLSSLLLASCGFLAVPAHAAPPTEFHLVIDITNPAAVTFTATNLNALAGGSIAVNFAGGITLENFFSTIQDVTNGLTITGNWTARGTTTAYDQLVTFDFDAEDGDVVAGDDLSIYVNNSNNTQQQNFITGASPFTGTSTVDFSGFELPEAGTWGQIHIGFLPMEGSQSRIGFWTVVSTSQIPEPSSFAALAGLGALALAGIGRRRRARG